MDVADPEALPDADDAGDDQAEEDHGDGGQPGSQKLRGHGAHQADGGADGQVDVTAGQDAQQHAAGHDQHVGVLQQQVGHVLGIEQPAAGQDRKENKDDHQRDDHGIFFK